MKIFSADDSSSLREALRSCLPAVGARIRRDQGAAETWVLLRAIDALDLAARLSFPVTLSKRERPDFELAMPGSITGVEVSECIPQTYARVQAIAEDMQHAGPLWRDAFEGLPTAVSRDELERRITSPPKTYGYNGDSMEALAAGDLSNSIDLKLMARAKPGFTIYRENWLLLYSNTGRPGLDFAQVLERLRSSSHWIGSFSQLLILHSQTLAVSRGNGFSVLSVPDLMRSADAATTARR